MAFTRSGVGGWKRRWLIVLGVVSRGKNALPRFSVSRKGGGCGGGVRITRRNNGAYPPPRFDVQWRLRQIAGRLKLFNNPFYFYFRFVFVKTHNVRPPP